MELGNYTLLQVFGSENSICLADTEGADLFAYLIPVVRSYLKQHGTIRPNNSVLFHQLLKALKAEQLKADEIYKEDGPSLVPANYYAVTKDGIIFHYEGEQFVRSASCKMSAGERLLKDNLRAFGGKKQKESTDRAARNTSTARKLKLTK